MNVSVFGLGKLGSPLAAMFAAAGHRVFGVDHNPTIVDLLRRGLAPVQEPGLQDLLSRCGERIECTDDAVTAAAQSEFVFLIIPTPSDETGCFSSRFLEVALGPIAEAIRDGAHPVVVVVSTTTPGTMDEVVIPALQQTGKCCGVDFDCCYNPEFIALGSVLRDMAQPSFILIGQSTPKAGVALEGFYRGLHETLGNPMPPVTRMSLLNAEIAKLAVNCYLVTKISFANSLASLCEHLPGADAQTICLAVGLDRRIGAACLRPGVRPGGPCLPRDNRALAAYAAQHAVAMPIAEATMAVSQETTRRIGDLLLARHPKTVAILGLTYKTNTPVVEESQALDLLDRLSATGASLLAHDPQAVLDDPRIVRVESAQRAVQEADAVLIATAWLEYRDLRATAFRHNTRIVDCWGVLDPMEFRHHDLVVLGRGPAAR